MSEQKDPVKRVLNNFFKKDKLDEQFKTDSRTRCVCEEEEK